MLTLKHKGTPIVFAVGTLLVPPMSLAAVEELGPRLTNFKGDVGDAGLVVDCLHAAVSRNYPGTERAVVADLVDLGNMAEVMGAVMKTSGLVSADEAEQAGKPVATSL